MFTKATRKQAKLRLALSGPSGSGKTMGALYIAKGIGGKIALIDTERSSASLYADRVRLSNGLFFDPPEFDSMDLEPRYTPERYIEAIVSAERGGYTTLIIDSLTHEWSGIGGCLEIVDEIARSKYKGNTWSAWNDVTPRHRALVDVMLRSNLHIIATIRSKTETSQIEESGKKKVVKLGMKLEQRDGTDYEFTTVLDLSHDGNFATSSKDRTGIFSGDPQRLSEKTGEMLLEWLNSGAALACQQPPTAPLMAGEDIDMHKQSINKSETIDDARKRFSAAWEAAKSMKDKNAADIFKAVYDSRVKSLIKENDNGISE